MRDYLILKLQGVMQAWGEHTFEGLRPSTNFPTRSALTGLLAACLGIDRQQQQALANSFLYAVRQDEAKWVWSARNDELRLEKRSVIKMTDYHTVKDAREDYTGFDFHKTIITQREYLLDAAFTVAIWNTEGAEYSLEQLKVAVCQPRYTPFLGRRSCPITRPLYDSHVQAINSDEALKLIEPVAGVIYSEDDVPEILGRKPPRHKVRDVPLPNQPRQFASRMVYVYGKENADVSE